MKKMKIIGLVKPLIAIEMFVEYLTDVFINVLIIRVYSTDYNKLLYYHKSYHSNYLYIKD